ncbi:MAG TPA: DUF389 domain-containing protein [Ornithinimicrobium sp.]|uniref:DUF389 domain-containing protein n=1 Tax=Ornithinimicrobium sp. TaxID=1977084 RepID=UPI002B47A89C|nr:DUF389 domain-containing protein [Ornithinimicrobium sp.]HKJ11021.1 DUF389 domain-containing protein [Ornithinimicrobium sp.]
MNIVGTVTPGDVERISGKVFMTEGDKSRNLSAFWVLLTLSAVIATAGVIADSTATVIGAMIVAPLMTPILGTAMSIVLARRRAMLRSASLVAGGALLVIAVGYLLGLVMPVSVVAETNSQVSGRVNPGIIDLVAALATGLVGAFALLRSEISDTLPGVAIAISLVPPLAVIGLTAEAEAWQQSFGALVLFSTNVAAIIATGTLLMLLAGVRDIAKGSGIQVGKLRGRTLFGVGAMLFVVSLPLAVGSGNVLLKHYLVIQVQDVADKWAEQEDWVVTDVSASNNFGDFTVSVSAIGQPPEANKQAFRRMLDDAELENVDVEMTLLFGGQVDLAPTESNADG